MVFCLADELRKHINTDGSIRVLFRQDRTNKKAFGVNELLYDIVAFSEGLTNSSRRGQELHYIEKPLWQIESEFHRNDRKVVNDFNKLVLGSAPYKLFVASRRENKQSFLEMLAPIAKACSGEVYLAIVVHPRFWNKDGAEPEVYRFLPNGWEELG
jgi:hypothetical protein